jgi:hypothetical protein
MFPNPQSAFPLPLHPSLERYRKIAKELVRACKSGQPESLRAWAEQWVHALVRLSRIDVTPQLPVLIREWGDDVESFIQRQLLSDEDTCTLADAQFVLARSHGFESWPKFVRHLESLAAGNSSASRFEAAADAIVGGDAATLKRLLDEEPELIRARSTREHGATLLHYVSANGVEGYRQKTSPNIVEIAEIMLRAGAEVDATADVYGGGCTTLGLAATSVHPERAGVQEALLQKLLDYGAEINRISIAGNGQSLVMACLANGRPKAAAYLASRGARYGLVETAALGQLDRLRSFFEGNGDPQSRPASSQLDAAFLYACQFGPMEVVAFLIEQGANIAARDRAGQTGLHHAVMGCNLQTVRLMLNYTELLEIVNGYGGTPAGQALWCAAHDADPDRYISILDSLFVAGAKFPARHATISPHIDAWLKERNSIVEPDWSW